MNGPLKMYQTKQIIRHDLPVEVPNCMYKMKNILSGHKIHSGEHVSSANRNLDISEQVNKFLKKYQIHPEMATLQIRQENILKQLAELKEQMLSLRTTLNITSTPVSTNHSCSNIQSSVVISSEMRNASDLVINASPSNPPYSLLVLQRLWANSVQLVIRTYLHSTVVTVPKTLQDFIAQIKEKESNPALPQLLIRLIWKEVDGNMELITSSSLNMPIHGESNILRYLNRIGPSNLNYESMLNSIEIDSALDICYLLSRSRTKTERLSLLQALNGKLGKSQWMCNSKQMSIADVAACSVIKQVTTSVDVNVNLTKWLQRCEAL